jgi:hypothetical protein
VFLNTKINKHYPEPAAQDSAKKKEREGPQELLATLNIYLILKTNRIMKITLQ